MSERSDLTLQDNLDTFRHLGHTAVDLASDYLTQIRQQPVYRPMTPDEREGLLSTCWIIW